MQRLFLASASTLILFFSQVTCAAEPAPVSIYHVDPYVDGAITLTAAGASLWAYGDSNQLIHPSCPCDPGGVNFLDRGAIGNTNDFLDHVSDVSVGAAVLFPVALDWLDTRFSKAFAEDMMIYAEALSLNGGFVTLAKYTVQRPLPRTYAGDPALLNSPRGYRSFYSGHTSIAFSALTTASMTYSERHPGQWWPWLVTGILGSSVAYERVAAGRHFPTDVIVGAVAGTAVGIGVPLLHRRQKEGTTQVALVPVDDGAFVLWKNRY